MKLWCVEVFIFGKMSLSLISILTALLTIGCLKHEEPKEQGYLRDIAGYVERTGDIEYSPSGTEVYVLQFFDYKNDPLFVLGYHPDITGNFPGDHLFLQYNEADHLQYTDTDLDGRLELVVDFSDGVDLVPFEDRSDEHNVCSNRAYRRDMALVSRSVHNYD
jgi:hypothetical protein